MIKRKVSILLIIVMLISALANVEVCAEELKFDGVSILTDYDIGTYSGEQAAVIDPLKGKLRMDLKAGGEFSNIQDGTSVKMYVRYFDKGTGKCAIFYDGLNGSTEYDKRIILTDTGVWKTREFEFQNPKFNGGIDGADIRLTLSTTNMGATTDSLIVSDIKLEKTGSRSVYNAKIITNKIADAYFSDEDVSFDVSIMGLKGIKRESNICSVTYEIVADNGEVIWSESDENVEISYSKNIEPENIKFGVLTFRVTAENKELGYKSVYKKEFSYTKAAPKNSDYGLATHYGAQWSDWGMTEAVHLISKTGTGFVRDGITWDAYEKTKGSTAVPVIKRAYMDELKKYNLEHLGVDAFGNPAYQPGIPKITYMPETDEAIEAFSNYCGDMAKLGMKYHEIWNEPNTGFNAGNTGWDVYAGIVKESYKKIKAADPKALVVPGSIVSIPDVPYNVLEQIFDAGAGDYMDAFCIHPYIWDASPVQTNFHGKLSKLREWMDNKGYPNIDIWITEMGWGAGPGQAFTFDEQAAYLAQSYIVFKAINPTGKFVWYDAVCDGLSETNREHNFGIINSWGDQKNRLHPRKAYVALANMNDIMVGADFVGYENRENTGYSYHFTTRDNKDMYAVFASQKAYPMGFKTDSEYVDAVDIYGNETRLFAQNGVINIIAGEEVKYLMGAKLTACEPTVYPENDKIKMVYGENTIVRINAPAGARVEYEIIGEGLKLEEKDAASAAISMEEVKKDKDLLHIKVTNNGKALLDGYTEINYIDAVEASILNVPYNDVNYNRWVGTLVVTNNSLQNTIRGRMVFDEPDLFAKKLHPVRISDIKPGETKRIKFHLPEILKKEVYDLNARIILDSGYVKSFADRIDFAVAKYAENITIDGVMHGDEWTMGTALAFNNPSKYYVFPGYTFNGTDDLSGKAVVAYDEENIYLGVQVTDDVFYCEEKTNGIWAHDSIQCAMAYARLNGDPSSTARTEFGMALTPEGEKLFTYSVEDISITQGEIKLDEVGGALAIKREGNVTTYELKMPLTQLFQRNAHIGPGYRVAFSLLINDNDGKGRKGGAEIASGIIGQKYIDLFTFLQFMERN